MTGIIIIISVSLILLLMLSMPVSLRVIKSTELTLVIDYSLFTTYIYPDRKKKSSSAVKKQKSKRMPEIKRLHKAVSYLLSKSSVVINDLGFKLPELDFSIFAIRSQLILMLFYVLISELSTRCADIRFADVYVSSKERALFDITLKFRLLSLLLAITVYFFSKNQGRKRKFNVKRKHK